MPEDNATLNHPHEREALIRMRAHEIWEREGRPDGKHAEHWAQAEHELELADNSA